MCGCQRSSGVVGNHPCEIWRWPRQPDVITQPSCPLCDCKSLRPSERRDCAELHLWIFFGGGAAVSKRRALTFAGAGVAWELPDRIVSPLWCPLCALLWNARWWRPGWRPPRGCLCGLPQWEQQRNIMKHELSESTHLQGWLLRLELLTQVDKLHWRDFATA